MQEIREQISRLGPFDIITFYLVWHVLYCLIP